MHFSMGVSFAQNPGCCKERETDTERRERETERERESLKCILSLVPYLPKNVFHMLFDFFFVVVVFPILLTRNLTRNA